MSEKEKKESGGRLETHGKEMRPFQCSNCNYSFTRKTHLARHISTQHSTNPPPRPEPVQCPVTHCKAKIRRSDHLRRHIRLVHKMNPLEFLPSPRSKAIKAVKCEFEGCNSVFARASHLGRHIKEVHRTDPTQLIGHLFARSVPDFGPVQRFQCSVEGCTVEVARKEHLRRHILRIHGADPQKVMGDDFFSVRTKKRSSNPSTSTDSAQISTLELETEKTPNEEKESGDKPLPSSPNSIAHDSADNQPFPQNYRNYDSGDDFSYGECLDYAECTGKEADEVERVIKKEVLEPDLSQEEDAFMCVICCSFSHHESGDSRLADNLLFNEFLSEIIQEGANTPMHPEYFNSLSSNVSVCAKCQSLVTTAISKKEAVNEIETEVRKLQLELLKEMRKLQERLAMYFLEMKKIGAVVAGADRNNLETFLGRNTTRQETGDNSLVLLVRDGILSTSYKLDVFCGDLKLQLGSKPRIKKKKQIPIMEERKIHEYEGTNKPERVGQLQPMKIELDEDVDDDSIDYQTDDNEWHPSDDGYDLNDSQLSVSDDDDSDSYRSDIDVQDDDNDISKEDYRKVKVKTKKKTAELKGEGSKVKDSIVNSQWSSFKKKLLRYIQSKVSRQERLEMFSTQSNSESGIVDPRLEHYLKYNNDRDEFAVGTVPIIIHDEEESLECSSCGFTTAGNKAREISAWTIIQDHIQVKHLFLFQCPMCAANLGSFRRYEEHIRGHKREFVCEKCDRAFLSKVSLSGHVWSKHMTAEEIEDAIRQGQEDPRWRMKQKSAKSANSDKSYQCHTCGKGFSNSSSLKLHERKIHSGVRETCLCPTCGKSFYDKHNMLKHQQTVCFVEAPPPVQCDSCPRQFKTTFQLKRHMKERHSQAALEKPFKCPVCNKGFSTKGLMNGHLRWHSEERPYPCQLGCGWSFKEDRQRRRHETKCTGAPGKKLPGTTGQKKKMKIETELHLNEQQMYF